jgi:YidC/Oxa1 family membrane protein insertase
VFNDVVHGMGRLLAYFYDLIPIYGVGIILLTILVRLAMIPLAVKQAHIMEKNRGNAEKMRKLLPEVKKIKEKYRDDKARQYEEQKKLYDQHEVNMLGGLSGCLPMLVQMPVFLAMYQVLSGCNKIFGAGRTCTLGFHLPNGSALKAAILEGRASFLGMNLNLRPSEVLQDGGLLPALPYYLLIAVMGYTMWYQTRQMMKAQPVVDPQMAQTQKIMQFMPLLLVFASLNFPAGLTVYWSATNIWSIAQQYVLMRKVGPLARPKEEEARAPGPLKGLASRLKLAAQTVRGGETPEKVDRGSQEPAADKPSGQTPRKAPSGRPKPAGQGARNSQAKPAAVKRASQGPRTSQGKPAGSPAAEPAARNSAAKPTAEKPAGQSGGKPPATKPAAKPGAKSAGAAGGRRPAASRARSVPSSKPGQSKTDAKGPASRAGSGTGSRPAATGGAPGRPKGSGARKKRQGR